MEQTICQVGGSLGAATATSHAMWVAGCRCSSGPIERGGVPKAGRGMPFAIARLAGCSFSLCDIPHYGGRVISP